MATKPRLSEEQRAKLDAIIERMEANGEPEENIRFVVQDFTEKYTAAEPPKADAPTPEPSTWDRVKDAAYQSSPLPLFERKNLPITGAALAAAGSGGALIPAIALAGMGGAGGETIGQILETIQGKRTTPDARAVLTEGGKQAALQATGGVIGKGLGAAARGAYRVALRPSKTVLRDTPNVVDVGLREGMPVTRGGFKRADAATTVSKNAADQILADAEAAGIRGVNPRAVIRALRPAMTEAKKRAQTGAADETGRVAARARAIRGVFTTRGAPGRKAARTTNPAGPDSVDAAIRATNELGSQASLMPAAALGGDPTLVRSALELGPLANLVPRRLLGSSITPERVIQFGDDVARTPNTLREIPLTKAQALKRTAQRKADAAYKARDKGAVIDDIGTLTDEGVARGFREGIEARVPGVRPVNQRTSELGGLTEALGDATDRNGGLLASLLLGTSGLSTAAASGELWPLLVAGGGRLLMSPGAMSTGAIAANRVAPQVPNLSRLALLALLDEDGATGEVDR